jgi:hypothetical protein
MALILPQIKAPDIPRTASKVSQSQIYRPIDKHDAGYAAVQARSMMAGAVALALYGVIVCHLLVRERMRALPATMLSLAAWLTVAFGLLAIAGGQS